MWCVKTHSLMYTVKTRGGQWCPALALLLYSSETKSFSESGVRLVLPASVMTGFVVCGCSGFEFRSQYLGSVLLSMQPSLQPQRLILIT